MLQDFEMKEETIVRENLMTQQNYSPYCGNNKSFRSIGGCYNPRVKWVPELNQFKCPNCGWVSEFPEDFIKRYKARWSL